MSEDSAILTKQRFSILVIFAAALISISALCQASEQHLMIDLTSKPEKKSTWDSITDSVSSGFKKSWDTVSKPFGSSDEKTATPDPTRISTPADPSADLYTVVGRNLESKKLYAQAEEQYNKALKKSPKHLGAMLSYGRFLDRQGRFAEAVQWYHRAIKAHPKDTRPLNHLALCLASHNLLNEAASTTEKAVRLEPKRAIHRNNMAIILVEMGNNAAAFGHLREVHNEATAYYNMGCLLEKRGDSRAALNHFATALKCDPKLEEARVWFDHLNKNGLEPGPVDTRVARRSAPRNNPQPSREQKQVPNRTTLSIPPNSGSISPENARPRQSSSLNRPLRTTSPVFETNPLRISERRQQSGQTLPPSTYRRQPTTSPSQESTSRDASSTSSSDAQQATGSTNVRWGTFFQHPQSNNTTVQPKQQEQSTTRPYNNRQNNNVVYPLPPIKPLSR